MAEMATRPVGQRGFGESLLWLVAICVTLAFFFPFYWAISQGLRNPIDTFTVSGLGVPLAELRADPRQLDHPALFT